MTIAQAFDLAVQHHQAGQLAEAEAIYRQILAVEPNESDTLHLLGVIAHQVGRHEAAVEMILKAIALAPTTPAFHSNLGGAYEKLGRVDAAVAAYRRAIELRPDSPEVRCNLGGALRKQGRTKEAAAEFHQALLLRPDYAEAYASLGALLADQGRTEEAAVVFRRVVELTPESPAAHNNLGVVLRDMGRTAEAITACRQAIMLRPGYAEAHCNLGTAIEDQGHTDEAAAAYRHAIQLKPDYPMAWNNLGDALTKLGQPDEAVAACLRAIQLQADFPMAHNNLGNALADQGRLDEAIAAYRRTLGLRPGYAEAHTNLGNALKEQGKLDEAIAAYCEAITCNPKLGQAHNNLGTALAAEGRMEEAIAAFRHAIALLPDHADSHSNLVLNLHYVPGDGSAALFGEHRRWEEVHATPLRKCIVPHANDPSPARRLRIGYVSPDFRQHSVAFFLEPLLANHDRSEVDVHCYADLLREDAAGRRLRGHATQWRTITGMRDEQVAELIRRDAIDILVDLAGHTARNRLLVFARKPAPVQVTYLGYCDTTGLSAMDYRLTDILADPPGITEHLHTEQLIRPLDCAWCFRPSDASPPVQPPPALGSGCITFGSFNARQKITDEMLALWSRLLSKVPGSRLLLKSTGFGTASVRQRTRELLEKAGTVPERIELVGSLPTLAEHLAFYARMDIALDTFPYHGTTTTCEALWMGVPVITLAGRTHASRVGVSLLTNAGLPELIAQDADDYVRIATQLAHDLPRLTELRATLRTCLENSTLTNAPRFALNVEATYREMWRTWCAKQTCLPSP